MKKILLAIIVFINALSIAYSQCAKPTSLVINGPTTITICQGSAFTLSGNALVDATSQNGGFTYSWRKVLPTPVTTPVAPTAIAIPVNTATAIPSFIVASAVMADAGTYVLRVEDGNAGNTTCYTEASVVVVVNSITVPGAIATAQTICNGDNPVAFAQTTAASGGNGTTYTYVWEKSINGAAYADIAGATNAIFDERVLTNATTLPVTYDYRRKVTSGVCPQVTSNAVRITVNPSVVAGVITGNQTICSSGDPVSFTQTMATMGGTGVYTYQWQSSAIIYTGYSNIAGATNATYDAPAGLTATTYYRRVDGSGTCATAYTNVITLTIAAPLFPGIIAADQMICYNTVPAAFTSTAAATSGSGTYAYQWEISATSGGPYVNIAGATNAIYTETSLLTTDRYYRRQVTSGTLSPCNVAYTTEIHVTVTPAIAATVSISASPTNICSNDATTFTATPANGGTLPIYEWSINGVSQGVPSSSATFSTTALTSSFDQVRVTLTSSSACASPATAYASTSIPVSAGIGAGTIGSDQTICYNTIPAAITQITAPTGIVGTPEYAWEASLNGLIFTIIPGATNATYTPTTQISYDAYIRRVTTDPGTPAPCNIAYSNMVHITVRPQLVAGVIGSDETICSGTMPTMITQTTAPTGGTGTFTYQWQTDISGTGTFTDIAGVSNSNYQAGVLTQTTSFRRKETSGICGSVTSNEITKEVDPNCTPFSTSITGPNPITPGQQNAVYSVDAQTGFTYTWSVTGGTIVSGQNTNSVTVDWDAPTANAFARTTTTSYSISVLEKNQTNQTKITTIDINTISTGTTLSQAQSGINVFPNPTTGSFNIEMPESGVAVSYDILDLTGLSVASGRFTSTGSDQQINADFGAGMYQVVLKYNNVVTCLRLSKVQ